MAPLYEMRPLSLAVVALLLGCASDEVPTELPRGGSPFTVDHRGQSGEWWARGADTRSSVVTVPGSPVSISGRGAFATAVARLGAPECLLNGDPIEGGPNWVEVRVELRSGGDDVAFINELRAINGNNKVALLSGRENVNV